MPEKNPSILPRQAVTYCIMFGVGLLVFVLLGIYPHYAAIKRLDRQATQLKSEIDAQRVLSPYYMKLATQSRQKPPQGLKMPRQTRLKPEEVKLLSTTFSEMARQNNLLMNAITPDIDSFIGDLGVLKMALTVSGRYSDFRQYLLKLAELPYLAHIEKMVFEAKPKSMQLNLQLWLAQK
jgi:hypothetical protein